MAKHRIAHIFRKIKKYNDSMLFLNLNGAAITSAWLTNVEYLYPGDWQGWIIAMKALTEKMFNKKGNLNEQKS